MSANKDTKRHIRIGIKWKMFAILICFVTLFAVTLWIFQIQMLNFFYQNAKFNEFENAADTLSVVLGKDDLVAEASVVYAEEYYNDIWVYRLRGGKLDTNRPIVYAEGTRDGFGPFMESSFYGFYEKAVANGGTYVAMIPMRNFSQSYFEIKVIKDNFGDSDRHPFVSGNIRELNAVYMSVHEVGKESYLIVQRSHISPMQTVIHTLENQVLILGAILILLALLLALLLSRLITRPIIRVNHSAKNLAIGRYNIEFSGHGYREIEELSETLNIAAKELSKNDLLQKELISNVSHDLRTPLTMIKGYSEVIRDIPDENTPENIQVIIDETERLNSLVSDMFDLSKLQSGARKPEMKEFCLTETVRSTMFRYEKLTRQDGYNIEFFADNDVNVMADSGMILQAIYNLINNAINYTGPDKYVKVVQSVSGDRARISVTDTGDGIAEDDIPYIWDRYYKVDRVHKRARVGTGLGLSIVKGILEIHNATYGVTTAVGKGTTFWFELEILESSEHKAETVEL